MTRKSLQSVSRSDRGGPGAESVSDDARFPAVTGGASSVGTGRTDAERQSRRLNDLPAIQNVSLSCCMTGRVVIRAGVRRSFITTTVREESQITPQGRRR